MLRIDFTQGDGNKDEKITGCSICGRLGVRVKTMSSDTVAYEHIITYDPSLRRDRQRIVDGCYRQKTRIYKD